MKKLNICTFTVARSDFGLLENILTRLDKDKKFNLDIFVGSTHYSQLFGNTSNLIKKKKLKLKSYQNNKLSDDVVLNIESNLKYSNKVLKKKDYKACIILGDRYEMMAIAISCLNLNIPIIHLCGGSVTKGSLDNIYRYCISKMAHAHFVETIKHKVSLIKNEIRNNIYVIGAPGLENYNHNLLPLNKIEKKLQIKFDHNKRILICCFHPDTTKNLSENLKYLNIFLIFLKKLKQNIIFTYPNADKNFKVYINQLKKFPHDKNFFLIKNLGKVNYFSLINLSDVVIGNSSSGIIETASFKVPTINLGKRQEGRFSNDNVINSPFKQNEMLKAYKHAISEKFKNKIKNVKNIYYKKNCSINFTKNLYDLIK